MSTKSRPTPAATAAALALNEARMRKVSPRRRRQIARLAVKARWAKAKTQEVTPAQSVTDAKEK
jgi:hypothetical protein